MMPMTKSPPMTRLREAADDVAGRRRPLFAARQDQPGGRDVEREPQDRRDQQHGRKGGEIERFLDPQRDHQDEHGKRDRQRKAEVDHHRRNGEEKQAKNDDNAGGEGDVLAAATGGRSRRRDADGALAIAAVAAAVATPAIARPRRFAHAAARGPPERVCGEPCARIERRRRRTRAARPRRGGMRRDKGLNGRSAARAVETSGLREESRPCGSPASSRPRNRTRYGRFARAGSPTGGPRRWCE